MKQQGKKENDNYWAIQAGLLTPLTSGLLTPGIA